MNTTSELQIEYYKEVQYLSCNFFNLKFFSIFSQMTTRTLFSILFFKKVVDLLTERYRRRFPLIDLNSCEVMGDLNYRHILLYIYAVKSDYSLYNCRYKETESIMINTFCIKWSNNDESYTVTGNVFL